MKKIIYSTVLLIFSYLNLQSQVGLEFDGNNDYLATKINGVEGGNPRTIEVWFKTNSFTTQQILVDNGSMAAGERFTFKVQSGKLRIESGGPGNSLQGTANVNDNNWHHGAVVYDPSLMSNSVTLYLDGQVYAQGDFNVILTGNKPVIIGARNDSTVSFNGNIDEVRIWNYARSANDISSTYDKVFCNLPSGLIGYYRFEDGIANGTNGNTTASEIPSAPLAELNNFNLSGTSSNFINGAEVFGNYTYENYTTICNGQILTIGNNTYNASGQYTDHFISLLTGCDSIVETNLTVLSPIFHSQTLTICANDSLVIGNNTYKTTGIYTDVLTGQYGCDSTLTTDLTILDPIKTIQTLTECIGFSINVDTNTYNATGIYSDTLESMFGCDSVVITELNIANHPLTSTVSIGGTLVSNQNDANYQWINCNNSNLPISGEDNQFFHATANGNYAVIIDNGVCEADTSDCILFTSLNVEESFLGSVNIYPNPAQNSITLASDFYTSGNVSITVKNILGETVFSMKKDLGNSNLIDITDLENGTYFITIRKENEYKTLKFIKSN